MMERRYNGGVEPLIALSGSPESPGWFQGCRWGDESGGVRVRLCDLMMCIDESMQESI